MDTNSRLRVLFVYQHLPHYRYGVFSALDSHKSVGATFAAGDASRAGDIPSIPRSLLRDTIRLENYWCGPMLWQKNLLGQLLRTDAEAVVFLGDAAYLSTWLGAVVARIRGRRVYFWTIGWHRCERGIKKAIRMAFYKLADKLLLYGEDAKMIGVNLGYPASRIAVIGNSMHSSETQVENAVSSTEERAISEIDRATYGQPLEIGVVARLTPEKRFDMLVRAAACLRARGMNLSLLICGEGPEKYALEQLAARENVPAIFPGAVYSRRDLDAVYKRLAVTVLPERAGLTVMQSLEYGCPVVTVDDPERQVPEFRAVREGITGALYSQGDLGALANAIARCLELRGDGSRLASACRNEVSQNWSPGAHAQRLLDAIGGKSTDAGDWSSRQNEGQR